MQFLRKYWLPIAAALILIVVAAAQCAPYMIEDMQRQQGRANVEALLAEGRYEEAQEEMSYWFMHGCNTDEDYARYFLCHAYVAYEDGDVDNADMYLRLSAKYRPERRWNEQTRAELPRMFERGVTSFKAYYAYDNLRLDDAQMYDLLSALRPFGGVLGVHCENGTLVNRLQRQQLDRGVTGPAGHPASRPPVVEAEAIRRLCAVAKLADSPVHIVHLSSAEGLEEVRRARAARQKVWAETCPQYLLLDESRYHLEGFEGAKYVMSPPLRSPADREALRAAVLGGEIDTISTDHCSYRFSDQKALGRDDFTKIPNGAPGIEHRPALIYTSFVASGLMTAAQMSRLLSENQAKLFGMWPRKGQLAQGADADITVWDPQARWVIRAEAQHQNVDYTPYEGFEAAGRARAVYVGGQLAAKDGEPSGASAGRYVKR